VLDIKSFVEVKKVFLSKSLNAKDKPSDLVMMNWGRRLYEDENSYNIFII